MGRGNSNRDEGNRNIWDVVASLAHALSDARDQLVGLINSDGNARGFLRSHPMENTHRSFGEAGVVHRTDDAVVMRCRGGGCCGNHVPGNIKKAPSVHHKHARGHVAFGNHSEFKPELFNSKPCKPAIMAACCSSPPRRTCCGKPGAGVSIGFRPHSCPPQYTCRKDRTCRSPSPSPPLSDPNSPYESKRHCIGNQYVAVLREEACRIRERRLEKECAHCNAKPRWTRC